MATCFCVAMTGSSTVSSTPFSVTHLESGSSRLALVFSRIDCSSGLYIVRIPEAVFAGTEIAGFFSRRRSSSYREFEPNFHHFYALSRDLCAI